MSLYHSKSAQWYRPPTEVILIGLPMYKSCSSLNRAWTLQQGNPVYRNPLV
jgi:hypothetical protein